MQKPIAILNIGGVANVTYLGADGEILAFDTGTGNALIDDFVKICTGRDFDHDGELAHAGRVQDDILAQCLRHPYFSRTVPKSLDRNEFTQIHLELRPDTSSLNEMDAIATLTAFTVQGIVKACDYFPFRPQQWLVCGGGRKNKTLMAWLHRELNVPVHAVEEMGWNGDAVEAEGFAYLAVRSLLGLPLSLPTTTGVPTPTTGGVLFTP